MYFQYGEAETAYLSARDERMAAVIAQAGHIEREVDTDLFSAVVHHIVGQQISTKAQATIWKRMRDEFGAVDAAAVLGLGPVVAVVGVQVPFVESELGQQHGVAGQLVEVVEQLDGRAVHHDEQVEVVRVVRQTHRSGFRGPEAVESRCEGVPHDAVAGRGPVEGGRRGDASVGPLVRIDDADALSLVREAAVLHAAAVKIFVRLRLQGKAGFALFKKDGGCLLRHHGMILQIDHLEKRGLFTYLNPDLPRSDDNRIPLLVHIQPGNRLPGIVRQNAGFRFRLGVADITANDITENTEKVITVKIQRHPAVVVKQHFHGGRIDFSGAFNGLDLLSRNRLFQCGKCEAREGNGQSESQQDGIPEHAMVY